MYNIPLKFFEAMGQDIPGECTIYLPSLFAKRYEDDYGLEYNIEIWLKDMEGIWQQA